MLLLNKNNNIVPDEWKTLTLTKRDTPDSVKLPVGPVLVPLSVWQARRAELIYREHEHGWPLGIWLAAEEGPESIEQDIEDFTVIAVVFDKYTDGKAYETARQLRDRYNYKGELRAIGDVPHDRVSYRHQVGFDAFTVGNTKKNGTVHPGWFRSVDQSGPIVTVPD